DGIRDFHVTGVQTCALPISLNSSTAFLICNRIVLTFAGISKSIFNSYQVFFFKISESSVVCVAIGETAPPLLTYASLSYISSVIFGFGKLFSLLISLTHTENWNLVPAHKFSTIRSKYKVVD